MDSRVNGDYDNDNGSNKAFTTPAVRKIAKENNIDLSLVRGSGPNNRILKEDVLAYISGDRNGIIKNSSPARPSPATYSSVSSESIQSPVLSSAPPESVSRTSPVAPNPPTAVTGGQVRESGGIKRVPIRGVQRQMMKSMTRASQVQHLTYGDEVRVDNLKVFRDDLRKEYSKRRKQQI